MLDTVSDRINAAWDELLPRPLVDKIDHTAFLTGCREGTVTRRELEVYLVQQHHYSKHFTRYLCALLVNLATDEDREALIENLFEEMGLGDLGEEPHSKIYRDMLNALQLDPKAEPALPETVALVDTMLKNCLSTNPLRGLGALCLAAEAIVPHLYSQILHGLRAHEFPEQHLRFFPLHIEGDDDHALTMKAIIDRELARNPGALSELLVGAQECMERRTAFFEAVSRAAAKEEVSHAV